MGPEECPVKEICRERVLRCRVPDETFLNLIPTQHTFCYLLPRSELVTSVSGFSLPFRGDTCQLQGFTEKNRVLVFVGLKFYVSGLLLCVLLTPKHSECNCVIM